MIPTHVCYRAQPHQLCLFASLAHITPTHHTRWKKQELAKCSTSFGGERLSHVDPIWSDLIHVVFPLADLYDVLRCPQMSSDALRTYVGAPWLHFFFVVVRAEAKKLFGQLVKSVKSRLKHHLCCMYPKMACVRPIGTQCRGIRCSCAYGLLTLLRAQQHQQCLRCQYWFQHS